MSAVIEPPVETIDKHLEELDTVHAAPVPGHAQHVGELHREDALERDVVEGDHARRALHRELA